MMKKLHAGLGSLSLVWVLVFWTMTVMSWLSQDFEFMHQVKTAILFAMIGFIPTVMGAGLSGFRLAKGRGGAVLARKMRRMKVIAFNGLVILLPAAIYLYFNPFGGFPDRCYVFVSALELSAGGLNILFLSLNMRDGLRLSGRL